MKKIFDTIVILQKKITASLLLGMVGVVTIQIVARLIFHISTAWTEEVSKFMLIWLSFIGAVGALIKGDHMLVDILSTNYSPRVKKYSRILNDIVVICFSAFLFAYGIKLCANPIIWRSLTPAMQIPRVCLYVILPITMAIMLAYSIYDLIISIQAWSEKNKDAPKINSKNDKATSPQNYDIFGKATEKKEGDAI
ncbi:MAG TPA: TRAP transporter small permease [Rectinemataceae bacterium]|nr:TRAP transporter small permease [Rectinemataceae bacterium]